MSKITIFTVVLFFLNHCSLNKNSKIWNNDENEENFINKESVKKLFVDEEIISKEFNPELAINLSKINNNEINNRNDYGSQNYKGLLNKEATYSYSKLENIKKLDYKPAFLNDGLVFFDKKGTITKYDKKKLFGKKIITINPKKN